MVVGRVSEGDDFLNPSAEDSETARRTPEQQEGLRNSKKDSGTARTPEQQGLQNSKKFRNLCPEPAAKAMRLLKCHRIDGNAPLSILYHSVSDG
jgi:hypothetical protein